MQWSFSNKGSSPQLLSFQEDKPSPNKSGFDSLKSPGLVSITTKEAFNYVQKNIVPQKQGGVHYSASIYATKHIEKHTIRRSITNPSSTSVTTVKPSFVGPQKPPSAVQHTNSVPSMPSSSPLVGSTELRNGSKISFSDLLTIFYNGSVCVFDNVASEKAEAIMLLGRNSPPTTCGTSPPVAPAQTSVQRSSINLNGFVLSQPYSSACSSPLPIKSMSLSQSAGRFSNNTRDTAVIKPATVLESSFIKAEPLRAVYHPRSG